MKTKLIFAAMALSFTMPAMPIAHAEADEQVQTSPGMVTANVNGMVCDFCARAVTKVFGKNQAVEAVEIDLDNGQIHIQLKAGETLSDGEIEKLVKKSGYALESIDRPAV